MKILQVYKDVFPEVSGGIERYIHDLSFFLKEKGHSVEILVAGGGIRKLDQIDVTGLWCPARILSNPIVPGYSSFLSKTKADVIHFHLPLPSAVIAWQSIRKKFKKPYIVTYHSDIVRQAFAMPFYGPILRKFLHGASAVIATSQNYVKTSDYLRELTNSKVIAIGVNLERFNFDSKCEKEFYLFVGRFRRYKGIFVLLEAWRKMEAPPRLILAGGGGVIEEVRKYIALYKLPVEIASDVSDDKLIELYQKSKALILPSIQRSEAFGMVQVEAMACGTPVISSNLPTGVSWVNQHKKTGLLFTTGDSVALKESIIELEKSEKYRRKLGKNARIRAEKFLNDEVLFEKVEECLIKATEI